MLTKLYRTLEMHVPGQWNADGTMYHDDASMPSPAKRPRYLLRSKIHRELDRV